MPLRISLSRQQNHLLVQGQTQGSAPRADQQALTTGPFGNACEADAVLLEVAMGSCRTQMSTTKGIQSGSNTRTTHHLDVNYQLRSTSCIYIIDLTQQKYIHKQENSKSITHNTNMYVVRPLPRATSTKLVFIIYQVKAYNSIYALSQQIFSLSLFSLPPFPVHLATGLIFTPS